MKPIQTKGRQLIRLLKRCGMTYMEMLDMGISTCPWKRIQEQLRPGEVLVKRKNARGLVVWRVVSTKWTA